jgi:hypothetical protein
VRGGSLRRLALWAALAAALHALWEIAQLPLYALWSEADRTRIVAYVAHCIAGDMLIATLTFLVVAAVLRRLDWPRARPWSGGGLLVMAGFAYTVFSEWYNVYRVGAWSYAPQMPLVAGIGLTPLLQWLIVPTVMVVVAHRWR